MSLQTINSRFNSKLQHAELRISLDPSCSYNIHIQRAEMIDRIASMVRDRWILLYPIMVGLILLTIAQRFDCVNEKNETNFLIIITVNLIICLYLNIIVEFCVAVIILHIAAIATCCLVIFSGSVAQNIAVR